MSNGSGLKATALFFIPNGFEHPVAGEIWRLFYSKPGNEKSLMRALLPPFFPFLFSICVALSLLCFASLSPAIATDSNPFILGPSSEPQIVQMVLDPPLTAAEKKQGTALKCAVAGGLVHIRDGKLQICLEGKWRDVVLQR
jgi:hypothetical protein